MLDQLGAICRKLFARPSDKSAAAIYDGYMLALDSRRFADLMIEFDVTSIARIAPCLATWAHETGGFRVMHESGTYTSVDRIMQIFGAGNHSAGITRKEAPKYVRNPVALFERVYGLGNPRKAAELGNHTAGDGWKFRGCGIQQLTGRRDHERYAAEIGCSVDAMSIPMNSIQGALIEWRNKDCNAMADRGDLRAVRRAINGGYNGWEDFNSKCALLRKALEALEPSDMDDARPRYLSLGDRGPEVTALQQELRKRGFYGAGVIDETFGAMTQRALVAFQAAQGVPVTGVYDPPTIEAMAAAPPEKSLPGRIAADVTGLDAISRLIAFAKRFWQFVLTMVGVGELANQSGIIPLDKTLTAIEKTGGLFTKLSIQPRFVVYGIVATIAISFIAWSWSAEEAKTEAKKTGATT